MSDYEVYVTCDHYEAIATTDNPEIPLQQIVDHVAELKARVAYFKDRQIKDTAELVQQRSETLAAEATIQRVRAACDKYGGRRISTAPRMIQVNRILAALRKKEDGDE